MVVCCDSEQRLEIRESGEGNDELQVFAIVHGAEPLGNVGGLFDVWFGEVSPDLTDPIYSIGVQSGQSCDLLLAHIGSEEEDDGFLFVDALPDVMPGSSGANFTITAGHAISGRLTRAEDEVPLSAEILVQQDIAGTFVFMDLSETNANGEFRIGGFLPDGNYRLLVRMPRYLNGVRDNVTLVGTDLGDQDIDLTGDPAQDTTSPVIGGLAPFNTESVSTALSTIEAHLSDHFTEIDSASIATRIDGETVSHSFDSASQTLTFSPATPLLSGSHTATVTASDTVGNSRTATWTFTVP